MFRPLCLVPDLSLKKEMNNEKHKCLHLVTMPTFGVKTRTDRLPMIVEINKLHKWLFSSKFNFFYLDQKISGLSPMTTRHDIRKNVTIHKD